MIEYKFGFSNTIKSKNSHLDHATLQSERHNRQNVNRGRLLEAGFGPNSLLRKNKALPSRVELCPHWKKRRQLWIAQQVNSGDI